MKCKELDERLSAYVQNELSQSEREIMKDHLANCEKCSSSLATYIEVREKLVHLKTAYEFSGLTQSVMSKIKAGKNSTNIDSEKAVRNGLFPRPLWRSMVAGTALALAILLGILMPGIIVNNGNVAAAEIALNSQQIHSIFGNNTDMRVEEVVPGQLSEIKFVVLQRSNELYVVAEVNKTTGEVGQTWVLNITPELKNNIKEIAGSNYHVQELLVKGAVFNGFTLSFWQGQRQIAVLNGDIQELGPIGFIANITIDQGIRWHNVAIDLSTREVINITPGTPVLKWFSIIFTVLVPMLLIISLIILAAVFRKFIVSAGYLSILLGIITCFLVFMYQQQSWILYWLFCFLPPVVGLLLGTAGMLRERVWKGKASNIIGIILCLFALVLVSHIFILWNSGNSLYIANNTVIPF